MTKLLDDLAEIVRLQKAFDYCTDRDTAQELSRQEDTLASELLREHGAEIELNARKAFVLDALVAAGFVTSSKLMEGMDIADAVMAKESGNG